MKRTICIILLTLMASVTIRPTAAKAIVALTVIEAVKKAYDTFNSIKNFYDPDPTAAELILQAKEEILNEINEVRDEEFVRAVDALVDGYLEYLDYPTALLLGM